MLDGTKSGHHGINVAAGHLLLGMRCLREIVSMSEQRSVGGGEIKSLSAYTMKYVILHLVKAGKNSSYLLDIGG